jgi:hypothetical protein
MNQLIALGLFSKVKHGGNFHRNSYRPIWARFRAIEAEWQQRAQPRSAKPEATGESPVGCQSCHSGGGDAVTQTSLRNHSKKTYADATSQPQSSLPNERKRNKGSGKVSTTAQSYPSVAERFHVKPVRAFGSDASTKSSFVTQAVKSGDAGRAAAERRWNQDLCRLIGKDAALWEAVMEGLPPAWQVDATEAEFRKPGSGIHLAIRALRARGIVIRLPNQREAEGGDGG